LDFPFTGMTANPSTPAPSTPPTPLRSRRLRKWRGRFWVKHRRRLRGRTRTRSLLERAARSIHVTLLYLSLAAVLMIAGSLLIPSLREPAWQFYASVFDSLAAQEQTDDTVATELVFDPLTDRLAVIADLSAHGVSSQQLLALRNTIARRYRVGHDVVGAIIPIAYRAAEERELDPLLVLAVIAIESRYNPFAESHVGARGLMQIMARVHREKFSDFEGGTDAIYHPEVNIKVGTQILHDCIRRRGTVKAGLACYVGALGSSDGGYSARVLAERQRISRVSGIKVQ